MVDGALVDALAAVATAGALDPAGRTLPGLVSRAQALAYVPAIRTVATRWAERQACVFTLVMCQPR